MHEDAGPLTVFVDELPNGEWWVSSSRQAFVEIGLKMLDWGLTIDKVKEVLSPLYSAMAAEYGE